jgi:hypothetical protein
MKFRKYVKEKESYDMFGDPIKTKPDDRPKDKYDTPQSVVEKLRKNCSHILKFYQSQSPLWRGAFKWEKQDPLELHQGRVSTGRNPKDTPKFVHDYLNAGMKKKVGWPVRNGIPVTTVHMQAKTYGDKLIFFPFNGFKWAYTIGVRDLYIELDDEVVHRSFGSVRSVTKHFVEDNPWFTEKMDDLIKKTTNKPWKDHLGEVFFNVKKYYLYDPSVIGFVQGDGKSIDGNEYIFKELGLKSFGFHVSAAMNS